MSILAFPTKQFSKKGCSDDGFNNYVGVHFDFEVNVEVGVDEACL